MAVEIRQYTFTIPANTPVAHPVSFDMSFPAREVSEIDIRIPPGPNGLVGFAIQNSGMTLIPYNSDPYIITSNEIIHWPLSGQIDSGAWNAIGYNLDVNDHSVYFTFLLELVTVAAPAGPSTPMIDDEDLNTQPDSGTDQEVGA